MPEDDPLSGLPDDLGIGEDLAQAEMRLSIHIERRRYGKAVTVVTGFDPSAVDVRDVASALKRDLGTGGTVSDGSVELQGDHADRAAELLRDRGYTVDT